jgi:hypothetical protein
MHLYFFVMLRYFLFFFYGDGYSLLQILRQTNVWRITEVAGQIRLAMLLHARCNFTGEKNADTVIYLIIHNCLCRIHFPNMLAGLFYSRTPSEVAFVNALLSMA